MTTLENLAEFSPVRQTAKEITKEIIEKIQKSPPNKHFTTLCNNGTLSFSVQLATHGVAIHENRKTDREKNYRIRAGVNSLLLPHGLTIKRRRITERRAKANGFSETFNFYVLWEL
tara:strand:- start:9303 stop:9650 length:348 start_codon:yes stop_codon:yes gene_type:complete